LVLKIKGSFRHLIVIVYTFGLIGLGAANSLLLLHMEKEGLLEDSAGIVFDHSFKAVNDKTYCFWAYPDDEIVKDLGAQIKHSWSRVVSGNKAEHLKGMRYYMVESIALYDKTRALLERHPNIKTSNEEVREIEDHNVYIDLHTNEGSYQVLMVYDSRPPLINEVIGQPSGKALKDGK